MHVRTHERIDNGLCGRVTALAEGHSRVEMTALAQMGVDAQGLVHGGFIFGLADHAAMVAVNDPNVVLGSAQVRFLKPVRIGDAVAAEATVTEGSGKKQIVDVTVRRGGEAVLEGRFTCFILAHHVLEGPAT